MASSAMAWRHVLPRLAARCTVIAPDLLGHGRTAKPAGDYSLGAHATLLRDLLAVLGHGSATVVGHSFGGGVAMQFAYQFPERCERLVLVGSGGLGPEVGAILRALALPGADLVLPLFAPRWIADVRRATARWCRWVGLRPTAAAEEIWRAYSALADPATRAAFFQTLRAVVDNGGQRVNATDRLHLAAEVPTLIVWGARDAMIPVTHAHAAHAAIPRSRLEVFAGVGHFPHCEAPGRFARTLLDFIATTEPARVSQSDLGARLRAAAP
jgi:pimeloyl-ACP methyl ester carboxylesterase